MNPGMDMPVNVEVDPNEDTEWNDILRKHGILPEKPPSPTPMIEEAILEARRLAHENRLEGKTLDELDELEDDEDEDFLAGYRAQRVRELNAISRASVFNQVYHVQKPEYARDVTEASKEAYVALLLTSSLGSNAESALAEGLWRALAARFGDVKFCQMRANLCVDNFQERHTPAVFVYRDGDIRRQLMTLGELRGASTTITDFEALLVDVGAVQRKDPRLTSNSAGADNATHDDARKDDDNDSGSDWD